MLLRFDPFREFDRIFQESATRRPSFPMDAYRHGDTFVLHFDLPGMDPSSIDVEYERNVLTVTAERSWRPVEGDDVVASERVHGAYRRQLLLGEGLDGDRIHATYEHGVLTLTVPVAEKARPRKIEIQGTESRPESIETSTSEAKAN